MKRQATYYWDNRWARRGPHGISRFAEEVRSRLTSPSVADLPIGGFPTDPLDTIRLSLFLHKHRSSAFISPGFNCPLSESGPLVLTVHDLIHLTISEERTALKSFYYHHVLRRAARRASAVLTVSESSRDQIVGLLGVHDDRICVVGNGVSAAFSPTPEPTPEADTHPYFLFVGNSRPHKNVERLLSAFAWAGLRLAKLRVVGRDPGLDAVIRRSRSSARVVRMRDIDDEALAALYRGAIATVIPSIDEGFGLPALESMACGTPVVASDIPALRELVGDAGWFVNPRSEASIAAALHDAYTDSSRRRTLSTIALSRASGYTWDGVAARTVTALEAAGLDVRVAPHQIDGPGSSA